MTKLSLAIVLLCVAGAGTASADGNLPGKTGFNVDSPKFTIDVKNADSGINSVIHITSGGDEHDGGFITSAGTNNGAAGDNSNMFLSTGASFDGQGWKQESSDGKSVFYGSGPAGFRIFAQQNDNIARGTYLTDVQGNIIDGRAKRIMRIGYDGLTTFNGSLQIAPEGGENDGGWITSGSTNNIFLSSGASYDAATGQWIQRSTDGLSTLFGAGPSGFRVYMQQSGVQPLAPISNVTQVMKIGYDGVASMGSGLQLNTDSSRAQPPCDGSSNKPGMIWYNSTGSTDVVQICAKVEGVFGWRNLALQ